MHSQSVKPLILELADATRVSAVWVSPLQPRAGVILAHGAGAGMHHPFMAALTVELAMQGLASLRYQFPYMELGSKRPDPPALCHATVRSAVTEAARLAPGLPLFAGGKSFGARMTSQAQGIAPLPGVRGLTFVGFPLHPAGKPSAVRAAHLAEVAVPMLFLQGTRDALADLQLLQPLVMELGAQARLHLIEDADHAFHVRARSGRNDAQVICELAQVIGAWAELLV